MKEIEIRDLNLNDLCEKKQELLTVLSELAPVVNLSFDKLKDIHTERQYNGIRTLIVLLDDFIIGTGSIFIEQKFSRSGGKVGHIEDVAVLEDYQRTGIGRMLIDQLVDIAKHAGCYKVILNCSEKTSPFYMKLGFRKHEHEMRLDLHGRT